MRCQKFKKTIDTDRAEIHAKIWATTTATQGFPVMPSKCNLLYSELNIRPKMNIQLYEISLGNNKVV